MRVAGTLCLHRKPGGAFSQYRKSGRLCKPRCSRPRGGAEVIQVEDPPVAETVKMMKRPEGWVKVKLIRTRMRLPQGVHIVIDTSLRKLLNNE